LRDSIVPWSVTVCGKANKAAAWGTAPLKRDRARAAAREKQRNEQK